MFNEFLKFINCCKPKNELDKLIIKEENLGLSTNELTEKNKLLSEEIRQNIKKDFSYFCLFCKSSFSSLHPFPPRQAFCHSLWQFWYW